MFQHKSIHLFKWLSATLILAVTLAACGNPQSSIIGKWEVVSGTSTGEIYEFFQDGTLTSDGFAGKYSWPDKTHIKFEYWGIPIVYEFNLSDDTLTLTDSTDQSVIVMKRYKE